MSRLNIALFILALGLWSSIFLIRFRYDLRNWYLNKFDNTPPPAPKDGKMPKVSLPLCYEPPQTSENEKMVPHEAPPSGQIRAADDQPGKAGE